MEASNNWKCSLLESSHSVALMTRNEITPWSGQLWRSLNQAGTCQRSRLVPEDDKPALEGKAITPFISSLNCHWLKTQRKGKTSSSPNQVWILLLSAPMLVEVSTPALWSKPSAVSVAHCVCKRTRSPDRNEKSISYGLHVWVHILGWGDTHTHIHM